MKKKALLLISVLLASGCISSSSETPSAQERFTGLSNLNETSTYTVQYSLTGSGTDYSGVNVSISNFKEGERFVVERETPGGDRITRIYTVDNRTISCSAGLSRQHASCSLEGDEALHSMLQLDNWNLQDFNISDQVSIAGRTCQGFTARPQNTRTLGLDSSPAQTQLQLCIDTEEGYTAQLRVENSRNNESLLEFAAEKVETGLEKDLELPRSVAIVGHCTDSYEIDLTPLKEVEEAQITVNNYTETVDLPERFQKGVYSVPEENIHTGINDITVTAGETTQNSTCYRRPSS